MMIPRGSLFLLLGLILLGAGCRREPAPAVAPPVPAAAVPAQVEATIRPEPLRIIDTAQVEVSGCTVVPRYRWLVNGVQAEAGTARVSIADLHARRGDLVVVEVTCAGGEAEAQGRVANSPPQLSQVRLADSVVTAGKDVVLAAEGTDPDGDTLDYLCRWLIDGQEVVAGTLTLPGSYVRRGAQISAEVTATDGFARSTLHRLQPFVVPGGAPRFTSQPPQSFQVRDYRYQVKTIDPDGDPVTYRLEESPPGMAIDAGTGLVAWRIDSTTVGDFRVRIVAEDPDGLSSSQEFQIILQPPAGSR